MQIVLKGYGNTPASLEGKSLPTGWQVTLAGIDPLPEKADAWFDLGFDTEGPAFTHITTDPVFVSAMNSTQAQLAPNHIRINAWNGFWERSILEITEGQPAIMTQAKQVLDALGWNYRIVPDVPGMVSARIVSMIVNEAYYALGEGVSTREEIDIAMQLGTNYPYGPFAWAALIGPQRILSLLNTLATTDQRYTPAPALIEEIATNTRP